MYQEVSNKEYHLSSLNVSHKRAINSRIYAFTSNQQLLNKNAIIIDLNLLTLYTS